MGAQENKQTAQDAYAAFSNGDAEGAMAAIDDDVVWKVGGDNALTGTLSGKQEVGEFWGQLAGKNFKTQPHDFLADGDKVVVLTSVEVDGEQSESVDVLTYNDDGKLVAFDTIGDTEVMNRAFPK